VECTCDTRTAEFIEETLVRTFLSAAVILMLAACNGNSDGISGDSPSSGFQEGVNYTRVRAQRGADPVRPEREVIEFFSYSCSHCRDLRPSLDAWRRDGKPPDVRLTVVPVTWDDAAKLQARMHYTAEVLGIEDVIHLAAFREVPDTEERIAAFFSAHGVDRRKFATTFRSAEVESRVQEAARLVERYDVRLIPMIVIDGRYSTDVIKAGGQERLLRLMDELLVADAAAADRASAASADGARGSTP
jgi:protein dithiol oxidoreductase (disulfide-forming)